MTTIAYIPYIPPAVEFQARCLSSGTMASLTGKYRYDEIEPIQVDFIEFCEENSARYSTWQSAWNDFRKLLKFETPAWK